MDAPLNSLNSGLNISGTITSGQGEYLLFRKSSEGIPINVDQATYESAYQIFDHYSPGVIIQRHSDPAMIKQECSNRFSLIQSKIKELSPDLNVSFVPTTLLHMVILRKCIKEDVKAVTICPRLSPSAHQPRRKERTNKILEGKKCWHLCCFPDAGDNHHPGVKELAYRFNKIMIKKIPAGQSGFTHENLQALMKEEITFFKKHFESGDQLLREISKNDENEDRDCSYSSYPGPTANFASSKDYNVIKAMAISDKFSEDILMAALDLECSESAKNGFILLRGVKPRKDSVVHRTIPEKAHSLSLGTSMLAGGVFDGDATALYYMKRNKNGYAILIEFDQVKNSFVYIPHTNSIVQLFGVGEYFHARTKAEKGANLDNLSGVAKENSTCWNISNAHLASNYTATELTALFEEKLKGAFLFHERQ